MVQTKIVFSNDFELETIALFDTGADLSCIRYDLVPKRFHKKTKERLAAANDSALTIGGKVEASVVTGKFALKNQFILAKDLCSMVILGTPFINLITPYKVNEQGINSRTLDCLAIGIGEVVSPDRRK